MAVSSSLTVSKVPRRMRWRVISANRRSTRLSQEQDVGGEVQLAARIALEPAFHRVGLVRAVVVEDEVQVEMGRGLAQELPQEGQELLGAVTGQAFADDLATCHVESGEQRGGPVALVV